SNGHSQWFGYGKVNAAKAVRLAKQMGVLSEITNEQTQVKNTQVVNIPDNDQQGIKSAIAINEVINIGDIQVTVNITHDFLGDLEIYLIAPNNQRILLQSRTLGRRNQLQNTYTMRSHPALKQLLSQPAQGNWELQVIDYAALDVGKLNHWELVIGHGK
ncbi:proprotein convertase P-domain-containing protein, partial [Dolichospermum circinale CS-537/05]|nr:proprotein convertase P-domain-containing protein [Dolichospermum circinale CS-537/05]